MEKLKAIRDALLTVTKETYHYTKTGEADRYIIWAEDGEGDSIHADDRKVEQVITGTVDYYTPDDFDPVFDRIQKALTEYGIPYRFNSSQYEDETGLIHHEWVWEV
ncbi:hypothetical protein [Murimonas intestini]|uniref:Phage protein n=1 Tax=Murimonas intestini TaxID=1337051 RepID=A0AB73SZW8_9FIRM|nr:hypothetical protein [Murimonas intestini]MCR1842758.1 hypothetical protein [Murimonas intestini]MCR1867903.1 hypothetical protein [Murimonas intestini]MCR1885255.1 hypothetical protein [Murimonas intestini]